MARKLRVKTLRPWASTTLDGHGRNFYANAGDVTELPRPMALSLIGNGVAEETGEPLVTLPTTCAMWPCPECTFLNSEHMAGCERCGRRLR